MMKKRFAVLLMACLVAGAVMAGCSSSNTTESKAPSTSSAASKTEESKTEESKAEESKAEESKTEESKTEESKTEESKTEESAESAAEESPAESAEEGEESGEEGDEEGPVVAENPFVATWEISSYVKDGEQMDPDTFAAAMEAEAGSMSGEMAFDAEGNFVSVIGGNEKAGTYTLSETGSAVVVDEEGGDATEYVYDAENDMLVTEDSGITAYLIKKA